MDLKLSKKTVWQLLFASAFTLVAILAGAARAQTHAIPEAPVLDGGARVAT